MKHIIDDGTILTCTDLAAEGLWDTQKCDDRCHDGGMLQSLTLADGRKVAVCCFAKVVLIEQLGLPWPVYPIGTRVWYPFGQSRYEGTVLVQESDADDPSGHYWVIGDDNSSDSLAGREIGGVVKTPDAHIIEDGTVLYCTGCNRVQLSRFQVHSDEEWAALVAQFRDEHGRCGRDKNEEA